MAISQELNLVSLTKCRKVIVLFAEGQRTKDVCEIAVQRFRKKSTAFVENHQDYQRNLESHRSAVVARSTV